MSRILRSYFFDMPVTRRGDAWKIRTSTAAHQSLRLLQSEGTHPCSPFLRPDFEEIREDDSDRNLNLNDTRDQNIFKLAFFFGAKWAAFYFIWIAAQSHDGCPVKFYLDSITDKLAPQNPQCLRWVSGVLRKSAKNMVKSTGTICKRKATIYFHHLLWQLAYPDHSLPRS